MDNIWRLYAGPLPTLADVQQMAGTTDEAIREAMDNKLDHMTTRLADQTPDED